MNPTTQQLIRSVRERVGTTDMEYPEFHKDTEELCDRAAALQDAYLAAKDFIDAFLDVAGDDEFDDRMRLALVKYEKESAWIYQQ